MCTCVSVCVCVCVCMCVITCPKPSGLTQSDSLSRCYFNTSSNWQVWALRCEILWVTLTQDSLSLYSYPITQCFPLYFFILRISIVEFIKVGSKSTILTKYYSLKNFPLTHPIFKFLPSLIIVLILNVFWVLSCISQVLYKENLGTGTPTAITPEMERVRRNQENFSSVFLRGRK